MVLTEIDVLWNALTEIRGGHLPDTVVKLDISGNQMKSVPDLSHLSLTKLLAFDNALTEVRLKNLPMTLKYLEIEGQNIPCEKLKQTFKNTEVDCFSYR